MFNNFEFILFIVVSFLVEVNDYDASFRASIKFIEAIL